tara:strand:+ start:359 stop:1675 length:1317 start_codon:yes stop_codon:yes gene_type:complete
MYTYLKSFDRSYTTEVMLKRPDKYREIEKFSKESSKLITMGSNYSYAPIAFDKKSTVIDLSHFNRILSFDEKNKEITVEAGIKIFDFLNFTLDYNLWIPQLPGYPYISLGGAIATNAHGKSCGVDGTIRKSIKKIVLYHKINGWLNLSNEENKEIFDLTVGGLGLTGTIVSITFDLIEFNYTDFLTVKKKIYSIADSINNLKENNKNKAFVYSWNTTHDIENFGKGYMFINIPKKKNVKIPKILKKNNNNSSNFSFPFCFWNRLTINIFNELYYKLLDFKKEETEESFLKVVFPFIGKENYFRFFGTKGFVESQLLVPDLVLNIFLDEIKYLCKIYEPSIALFSFKTMSGEQKLLRFEGKGTCVTFDFVRNKKNLIFLEKVDQLCIKYNILPSLSKDSRINQNTFNKCYKESEIFREKLTNFDKNRIYQSEISHRLKI